MKPDAVDFSVSHVEPHNVDVVWQSVEPMVKKGLSHACGDGLTSDYLRESIRRGEKTLWVVHEADDIIAAVVLELVQHPAKKTLMVVLAAGRDFHRCVGRVMELLQDMAQIVGADTIEATTRKGMTKWLREAGWKTKATIMELPHERRRR